MGHHTLRSKKATWTRCMRVAGGLWLGGMPLTASTASAQALPTEQAEAEAPEDPKALAEALFEGFEIDEDNPEAKLPTPAQRDARPVQFGFFLMNLTEKAEEASKRGDHLGAAKYYRALAATVPDEAVSFRRLCAAYERAGDRNKAVGACGAALLRNGALVSDYKEYVQLVVAQKEPLGDKQIQHVDEAVTYLRGKFPDSPISAQLACQLGLRLKDEKRLAQCAQELEQRDPKDLAGISYAWLLAVMRLDRSSATALLERAKAAGADANVLQGMETATKNLRSPVGRFARLYGIQACGALLVLLIGLYAMRRYRLEPSISGATRKSNVKLR